jgi:hypothetical protein
MHRILLTLVVVLSLCWIPMTLGAAVSIDPPEVPNPYNTSEGRAIRDALLETYKVKCSGNESIETLRALYRKAWNDDQEARRQDQREVDPRYLAAQQANEQAEARAKQAAAEAQQAAEEKKRSDTLADELTAIGGTPDGDASPEHLRQLIAEHMAEVEQRNKEKRTADLAAARKKFADSVHVDFPAIPAGFAPLTTAIRNVHVRMTSEVFTSKYAHGQPWAPAAAHVLDALAARFAGVPGAPRFQSIVEEALPLYGQGCDDPMVLYACAAGLHESGKADLAFAMIKRVRKQLSVYAYPDLKAWSCLNRLLRLSQQLEGDSPTAETQAVIREWAALGAKILREERSTDPAELFLVGVWLGGEIYAASYDAQLREALRAEIGKGGIDPWLAADITGRMEITLAWIARGGGWANTVTDAGWQGFKQHLDLAEAAFTAAWKLNPALPDAPACMITVCMGKDSGFDQEKLWFGRAIAAQPDFEEAYLNLFEAWKPRWGGNYPRILEIGLQALRTKAFATGTPEFLLRACTSISDDLDSMQEKSGPFWATPGVWGNIAILFEGYLAEPSRAAIRDWDLTRYAAYAWKCGQRDKVKDIVARITGSVDAVLFKSISGEEFETVKWGIR